MPKPKRCRRVCKEPIYRIFKANVEEVILTVDEYEVIRLLDYENKSQNECALIMDISRTTVTEIYREARHKIADSLTNGKTLKIDGGVYKLCDGHNLCGKKCKKCKDTLKEDKMKVAVTYENEMIFGHFGHTENFKIYEVEDNKVVSSKVLSTNGNGHSLLAQMLVDENVNVLICGGIGMGAINALSANGIKVCGGVSGNADEAVNKYLNNELVSSDSPSCNHHGHGESHTCHEHGCHHD